MLSHSRRLLDFLSICRHVNQSYSPAILSPTTCLTQIPYRNRTCRLICQTTTYHHGIDKISCHVDSEYSNASRTFNFSDENWSLAQAAITKYPPQYKQAATAPLLDIAQRQCGGWLPLAAMNKVASILEVTPMRVYEVASFYTMFNRSPIGKYFIQVCGTTPCHTMDSPAIMNALKNHLGIEPGETTSDGLFTLLEVECLGACVNAPMMQINDAYYEDLTPESAIAVIMEFSAGRIPRHGPQNDRRQRAEPYGRRTSLNGSTLGAYAPRLEELDASKSLAK